MLWKNKQVSGLITSIIDVRTKIKDGKKTNSIIRIFPSLLNIWVFLHSKECFSVSFWFPFSKMVVNCIMCTIINKEKVISKLILAFTKTNKITSLKIFYGLGK